MVDKGVEVHKMGYLFLLIALLILGQLSISVSEVCTFQQSETYFSARRLGINSGRIFTGILML